VYLDSGNKAFAQKWDSCEGCWRSIMSASRKRSGGDFQSRIDTLGYTKCFVELSLQSDGYRLTV
jgi:hypothetical protein